LATGQIELGDLVTINYEHETSKLTFLKENCGALVGVETKPDPETGSAPVTGQQRWIESRAQCA